jgi:hypothetical protein
MKRGVSEVVFVGAGDSLDYTILSRSLQESIV